MEEPVSTTALKRLGRLVKERRVELKMRQATQLAKAMNLSSRVIGDIENGRRTVSDETYIALENALEWKRGSAFQVLMGGDPSTVEVSRLERATGLKPDFVASIPKDVLAADAFSAWVELYQQLLPVEFRYASAREIDIDVAQVELREVLRMAQQAADGGWRPWTPPWLWDGPGEPWKESYYRTEEGRELLRRRRAEFEFEPDPESLYEIRFADQKYQPSDDDLAEMRLREQERKDGLGLNTPPDVSDVDETLDAAANKGDLEPESVEFND